MIISSRWYAYSLSVVVAVQVCQVLADDTTMQETEIPEESAERTLSSTSSEQLIPKEKQTGKRRTASVSKVTSLSF